MEDIFKIINPQENTMLTQLDKAGLQEFLRLINSYKLVFRPNLNLDAHITYGLEIECDKLKMKQEQTFLTAKNKDFLNTYGRWQVKKDASVPNGGEIVSPILKDNGYSWLQVKQICEYLEKHAKVKTKAAGHVHIGANILNDDPSKLWHFLSLWMVYENIIFRFSYGEYLTPRAKIMAYAMPIASLIRSQSNLYQEIVEEDGSITFLFDKVFNLLHHASYGKIRRNEAVNFNNVLDFHTAMVRNTIEFRCPNGTINPVIWQNNVNLFANMLMSKLYCEEIVNERKQLNGRKYDELTSYNKIYLDQAIEFCDLIFAHNIDKVYFLKQYLKDYEVASKTLKRAKAFTK